MKHRFVISVYYPRSKDETCADTLKKELRFSKLAREFGGKETGGGGTNWKLNDIDFEFTYLKDLVKFYKEVRKRGVKRAKVSVQSEEGDKFTMSLFIPIERFI